MPVKVIAKVYEDSTDQYLSVPVLITDEGVIISLLEYTLTKKRNGASRSTLNVLIKSVQLFVDYILANGSSKNDLERDLEVFTSRLFSGTIDESGYDPTELYWMPKTQNSIAQYTASLNQYFDWISLKYEHGCMPMARDKTRLQKSISYAAWYRKNQNDFLGHIKSPHINGTILKVRNLLSNASYQAKSYTPLEFPEKVFKDFIVSGIGASQDARVSIRDVLIVLLMHFGGLRISEVLHLWVEDVTFNNSVGNPGRIRIFHPKDGKAPRNWQDKNGSQSRGAYLKERYGLSPRTEAGGNQYLGWKSRVSDGTGFYLDVHWFPSIMGDIFLSLWRRYLQEIVSISRNHPYAFICFEKETLGKPYTLNAFHYNYRQALKRIDLLPSKANGLTPHSHRHSYAQRLRRSSVDPIIIKKCMHHSSIESQKIYTSPNFSEINSVLNTATEQLESETYKNRNKFDISWNEVMANGRFSDIDPFGLFSGEHPVFEGIRHGAAK